MNLKDEMTQIEHTAGFVKTEHAVALAEEYAKSKLNELSSAKQVIVAITAVIAVCCIVIFIIKAVL